VRPDGGVGALSIRASTPLTKKVQVRLLTGLFADSAEGFSARDTQLEFPHLVINKPTLQLRLQPGVSLPLGSVSSGLEYTLLTTGSVDPTVGADLAVGGTWLFLAGASGRAPLYAGFDKIRQGLYGRADMRVARRVAGGAVFLGASLAGQRARGLTAPGFVELAPIAGLAVPLDDQWGAELGARVPVWTGAADRPYYAALRVGLTRVLGKRHGAGDDPD